MMVMMMMMMTVMAMTRSKMFMQMILTKLTGVTTAKVCLSRRFDIDMGGDDGDGDSDGNDGNDDNDEK